MLVAINKPFFITDQRTLLHLFGDGGKICLHGESGGCKEHTMDEKILQYYHCGGGGG
jgi:hypothetical protein